MVCQPIQMVSDARTLERRVHGLLRAIGCCLVDLRATAPSVFASSSIVACTEGLAIKLLGIARNRKTLCAASRKTFKPLSEKDRIASRSFHKERAVANGKDAVDTALLGGRQEAHSKIS